MEFTNEFTIPRPIDEAFAVLTDLERVAPCMPGATLEGVDGDTYSGGVKVKVGPMSLTYTGTATVTDMDPDTYTARIRASGREKRGGGTAAADVSATLEAVGEQTRVVVTTDLNVTGKPAQFGRGVMADVGEKIIERFAANLQDELEQDGASEAAPEGRVADSGTAGDVPSGPRTVAARPPRDDALDLMQVAGGATARRLAPVVAAAVAIVLLIMWRRRRR
jgi:uncharacterized protein